MESLDSPDRSPDRSGPDTLWFRIDAESAVGAARRSAVGLAGKLGYGTARTGEIAIAVTEMATNLHRHAEEGTLALRIRRANLAADERSGPGSVAVEAIAVDSGPGMADLDEFDRDGYSSGETLGIGLGAIARLASRYEVFSVPGRGTVLVAEFRAEARAHSAVGRAEPVRGLAAGLTRPMTGETECGDGYAVRARADGMTAVLCDGLGHGPLAATATQAALNAFLDSRSDEPATLLTSIHRAISHTRGAAVSVVDLDYDREVVRFAGLGNVTGSVTSEDHQTRGMAAMPGIAGHKARSIRTHEYPLGLVVLHTDGLSTRWSFDGQWLLPRQDPLVIAAVLLRDAGTRRDDAGIVVLRGPR